jgi:hypothetical protein
MSKKKTPGGVFHMEMHFGHKKTYPNPAEENSTS